MLHVKNQRYLQHLRLQMIELHVRTEHPQKILCRRKLWIRSMNIHTPVPLIMIVCMIAIDSQH